MHKREAHHRVNYLYQAAHTVMRLEPPNVALCRHYVQTLVSVCHKCLLKLEPGIKRRLCKRCQVLLVPGKSCRMRWHAHNHWMTVTCTLCHYMKRYPAQGRAVWSDRPTGYVTITDSAPRHRQQPATTATATDGQMQQKTKSNVDGLHEKPESLTTQETVIIDTKDSDKNNGNGQISDVISIEPKEIHTAADSIA